MIQQEQTPPTNPVEQVHALAKEGNMYSSLLTWFGLPEEQRSEVLTKALKVGSQIQPALSWVVNRRETPDLENFILKNFSILSSKAAQKLLMPTDGIEVTAQDMMEISDEEGRSAWNRFNKLVNEAGIKFQAGIDDFSSPSRTFTHFSLEEEREFLLKLAAHMPSDADLFIAYGLDLLRPIEHCDLLADPRLVDYVRETIFLTPHLEPLLANFLSRGVFPSPEFFEEVFKLKPEETKPDTEFTIATDKGNLDLPASLYYFSMLLRITKVPKDLKPEKLEERKQKIVGYLLNDQFMQRALPYLDTDNFYEKETGHGNEFIPEGLMDIRYQADIKATGEEAKKIKRDKFGKILKTGITYLEEKGDTRIAQKLREKEVAGIKYFDFLS